MPGEHEQAELKADTHVPGDSMPLLLTNQGCLLLESHNPCCSTICIKQQSAHIHLWLSLRDLRQALLGFWLTSDPDHTRCDAAHLMTLAF